MIREEKEQKGLANLFVWFINIGQSFALISKVVFVECTLGVLKTRVKYIETIKCGKGSFWIVLDNI